MAKKKRTFNIPRRGTVELPDGIEVAWSPVNQAWIVRWHDEVLRVIGDPDELYDYLAVELRTRRENPSGESDMEAHWDSDWKEQFVDGAARAFWVAAWVDHAEEKGRSFPAQTDLSEEAPETPLDAYVKAGELIGQLEQANGASIYVLAARASQADGGAYEADEDTAREFGWYLAMDALGQGVTWFDDHATFDLDVPRMEYRPDID